MTAQSTFKTTRTKAPGREQRIGEPPDLCDRSDGIEHGATFENLRTYWAPRGMNTSRASEIKPRSAKDTKKYPKSQSV
jgi:hypothetical protein